MLRYRNIEQDRKVERIDDKTFRCRDAIRPTLILERHTSFVSLLYYIYYIIFCSINQDLKTYDRHGGEVVANSRRCWVSSCKLYIAERFTIFNIRFHILNLN